MWSSDGCRQGRKMRQFEVGNSWGAAHGCWCACAVASRAWAEDDELITRLTTNKQTCSAFRHTDWQRSQHNGLQLFPPQLRTMHNKSGEQEADVFEMRTPHHISRLIPPVTHSEWEEVPLVEVSFIYQTSSLRNKGIYWININLLFHKCLSLKKFEIYKVLKFRDINNCRLYAYNV